jgi:NADH-quinone oxidoreductase subunit H
VVLFLGVFFFGEQEAEAEHDHEPTPEGYAGGFPVPVMPTGGAVRGPAGALTFAEGRTVTAEPVDAGVASGDGAPYEVEEGHES